MAPGYGHTHSPGALFNKWELGNLVLKSLSAVMGDSPRVQEGFAIIIKCDRNQIGIFLARERSLGEFQP